MGCSLRTQGDISLRMTNVLECSGPRLPGGAGSVPVCLHFLGAFKASSMNPYLPWARGDRTVQRSRLEPPTCLAPDDLPCPSSPARARPSTKLASGVVQDVAPSRVATVFCKREWL